MTLNKWTLCWFDAVLVDLGINTGEFLANKMRLKDEQMFNQTCAIVDKVD